MRGRVAVTEPCGCRGAGLPLPAQPRLAPPASAPPATASGKAGGQAPPSHEASASRGHPRGPADRVRRLRLTSGGYSCWRKAPLLHGSVTFPYVICGRRLLPTLSPHLRSARRARLEGGSSAHRRRPRASRRRSAPPQHEGSTGSCAPTFRRSGRVGDAICMGSNGRHPFGITRSGVRPAGGGAARRSGPAERAGLGCYPTAERAARLT